MQTTQKFGDVIVRCAIAILAIALSGSNSSSATPPVSEPPAPTKAPASLSASQRAPYSADEKHPWNELHREFFVRTSRDGGQHLHTTDPHLYRGGTWLLEGKSHETAIRLLDRFLASSSDRLIDHAAKRLMLQRDLWGAFDYAAWYPDDWVFKSSREPAAKTLRGRLARSIGRLALEPGEIDALQDNYAQAVKERTFLPDYEPSHPERPFLPDSLFDAHGPWVRFHEATAEPMASRHFDGAGGRAAHVIFLRLPEGREATEAYLAGLSRDTITEYSAQGEAEANEQEVARFGVIPKRWRPITQFPQGTMVAMVRRALAVDSESKLRATPITELVQIRVYRRIPCDPRANKLNGDFGEQDVFEFALDRQELYAGRPGLRLVGPDALIESFERREPDPYADDARRVDAISCTRSCIECHQAPGVYSMLSMERGFNNPLGVKFREYAWDVEMRYTTMAKVKGYEWGLLQGLLEGAPRGR